MTPKRMSPPVRFSLLCAWIAFCLSSFLPIWREPQSPPVTPAYRRHLFAAVDSAYVRLRMRYNNAIGEDWQRVHRETDRKTHLYMLRTLVVVLFAGGAFGLLAHWLIWGVRRNDSLHV